MIYCFDIDGTLCTNTDGAYETAQPRLEIIACVNALYGEGHRIVLYTARGSTTDVDWRLLTEQQLAEWGVRYHELCFGKPNADVFIDDKGLPLPELLRRLHMTQGSAHRTQRSSPTMQSPQDLSAHRVGHVAALILARGGSKGVPKKNIRMLGGHPLIAYSIVAARACSQIDRVIVSTDSPEIAGVANRYGAETPFLRPSELAQDASMDIEAIQHAIQWLKAHEGWEPELLVHLRPTTPLRDPQWIREAVHLLQTNHEATSLRSVHEVAEPPQKLMGLQDGFLVGLFPDETRPEYFNLPRQAFPAAYHPNGYVDVLRTDLVREGRTLYGSNILGFQTPLAVEIDRPEDLDYVEYLLTKDGHPLLHYLRSSSPLHPAQERDRMVRNRFANP